ncbi:enoyl-CoA hydratase-related protein [Modestobacter excelsi]|uniref:enoyl-CoA hydratase-related protein n=1 Tax=Modestobacter excelsi TaxID=2213161 RepID=UPI00110CDBCD|nr:enoyl-CoA hydratase-related protein [Modestobacter excelsi]
MSHHEGVGRQHLLVDRDGGATRLTLNRPDRLNAVTNGLLRALADEVERASADDDCRVIVITGAGRGFCSGADLVGFNDVDSTEPAGVDAMAAASRIARAVARAPKPVIALLNGPAAGIGAALALSCDLVLAAESSFLKLGFDQLGIMPDGGATAFLTVSLGRHRAMQYALLGDRLPAHDAQRFGLVARVWPDDRFLEEAATVVHRFATGPVMGIAATKRAINSVALPGLDEALEYESATQVVLLQTADYAEGVAAFQDKRPPTFTGQ